MTLKFIVLLQQKIINKSIESVILSKETTWRFFISGPKLLENVSHHALVRSIKLSKIVTQQKSSFKNPYKL